MIEGMNHFTVLSGDLDRSLDFYVDVIGLAPGPRPDLGFPGAWLYANGQAVLHIIAGRTLPAHRAGVIDHMAFTARGLREARARLDQRAIPYEVRQQRGSGTWQLFCHDPDGAKVELDFEASEQR